MFVPLTHTKIYGGDSIDWTHGDEHGVECFWRNIFGGAATRCVFHRPPYGIGLNEHARKHIRSARILLEEINIFECKPDASHIYSLIERLMKLILHQTINSFFCKTFSGFCC